MEMTLDCIRSINADVQLILIADNQPYTTNTNVGLRAATGDILVVGNNDLTFSKGWLEGLLKPLHEGYDIATVWAGDQEYILEDRIEDNAKFGSLFAMTREAYTQIGDFDEQFKGYWSDNDYKQRALELGLKIGKNLNCVVEHRARATYQITDPYNTEYLRSQRLFEAKWGYVE